MKGKRCIRKKERCCTSGRLYDRKTEQKDTATIARQKKGQQQQRQEKAEAPAIFVCVCVSRQSLITIKEGKLVN